MESAFYLFRQKVVKPELGIEYDEYQGNPLAAKLPPDQLVIRTHQHHQKLEFIAAKFWLEYNLREESFVQNPTQSAFNHPMQKGLSPDFLRYMLQRYKIKRLTLMDDFYEECSTTIPLETYPAYLYLFQWLKDLKEDLRFELALNSSVEY